MIPLCGPWGGFDDATIIVRESSALVVGRTGSEFDERAVGVEEVESVARSYMALYDWLAGKVAKVLGVEYSPAGGGLAKWLRAHVAFIDVAGVRWAKIVDGLGPFTVRRYVKKVYLPYIGHSLTLTYVAYPYPDALVVAENKGRTMAIGSVWVEWGGVKVASAGLRTLPGALLLAQGAPELTPQLGELKKVMEEFVTRFASISACR